jgi:hypothetical protein
MRLLVPLFLIQAASLLAAPPPVSFNRDIRPIMSDTCFHCHGFDPKTREASLRLDIREEAIKKTEEGTLPIVPGDPDKSEIITRIFDDEDPMPPEKAHKPFTTAQKELFRRWVAEGAVYEPHWAYTPLTKPTPPKIADHPIDAFIQAKLAEKNLSPSPKAPDHTLLRRLSLDLTGLPPSKATSSDPQSAIDSLLASPHFGERMAVWWLDIARFADTVGFHGDQNQRIFPYRDYVIDAFNQNKRFDQFTIEQLAGDLLPNPTPEQLVATGYNRLNMVTREGGAQPKEYLAKYGAERVRSVAAAWFGSTFGCAECHDHKFDPIKTRDFYELQSFFADVKQWGVYASYIYTPEPELKGVGNHHPFYPEARVKNAYLAKQDTRLRAELEAHYAEVAKGLSADPKVLAAYQAWQQGITATLARHPTGLISPAGTYLHKPAPPVAAAKAAPKSTDAAKMQAKSPSAPEPTPFAADSLVKIPKALGKGDDFALRFDAPGAPVAAVRIDLPKGSLPVDTNASLSVRFAIADAKGKERPVGVTLADAAHREARYDSGGELTDINGGWSLKMPAADVHAVWVLDAPVTLKPDEKFVVRLAGFPEVTFNNVIGQALLALRMVKVSLSPLSHHDPLQVTSPPNLAAVASARPSAGAMPSYLGASATTREALLKARALNAELRRQNQGYAWTMVTQPNPKPLTVRVLPRGNWQDETGPVVLPSTPSFLPGRIESTEAKRLTRLDLAKWITSKENPITARTVMNRLWAQFFGIGLSAVVDDFGSQGELPSHPELLDWLASEFRDSGWDMKHMIRLIVTSQTYQQSSSLRPELRESDPANRLLASQNPRRLEAEFVRDNALAASGLLNLDDIGGPSVKPYQPAGYYEAILFPNRDYIADTGSHQWRRGLYMHWQRMFLHPMLVNFDAPARDECAAARINSNTPQQALTLLNDPTFVEAARVLAARLLQDTSAKNDQARIAAASHLVFNREPKPKELESLAAFLTTQRQYFAANPNDAAKITHVGLATAATLDPVEHAVWTQLARVLLNTQETITRY